MSLKQQLESLFLLDTVKPQASCCPSIDESLEALTRRWRLCEAADSYLKTCIPNRRVELSVHALLRAAQQIATARGFGDGLVTLVVSINDQLFTVRGTVIDGVFHIATAYIPK